MLHATSPGKPPPGACCWTSACRMRENERHEPLRRRRARRPSRRLAARRAPAAEVACGSIRPGASDRSGRRADAPARAAVARLDDLLGAARQRQDDGRAADRRRARRRLRAGLGDPSGRGGTEEDLRRRAGAPRAGAGDASLRRRDPSLQPRAAGFLPAGDGGRGRDLDRRDDRKSLVRIECGAFVPRARARFSSADERGAGGASRARRAPARESPCRSTRRRARR